MQQFINNILQFFSDLWRYINLFFTNDYTGWTVFIDKHILSGTMIATELTIRDIVLFLIPIIFVFIIFWLFIRFFLKLLKVITG